MISRLHCRKVSAEEVCNVFRTIYVPRVLIGIGPGKSSFPTIPDSAIMQSRQSACKIPQTTPSKAPKSDPNASKDKPGGGKRDLINFPRPVQLQTNPPTMFGFIPQTWFDFFYKKTGVTGGYMFLFGMMVYLLSKEKFVFNPEAYTTIQFCTVAFIISRYVPEIRKKVDQMITEDEEEMNSFQTNRISGIKTQMDQMNNHKSQVEAVLRLLPEAKRENVYLQMEAIYRQQLWATYLEVKKRLDYMVEKSSIESKYQKDLIAHWVLGEVYKSITPELKRIVMLQAIEDVKKLSVKSIE
ncbi:UNVERIFIED_CONTAM: hypothetical protein PYX00_003347 [Menopon gallinae]|uniref:ATP synthase subunit b n=1 Tax=Menopon gallinae TaxID=328185 RepID=A0AAW2I1D3_9NEOP